MKKINLNPWQRNAVWTCLRYMEANCDEHGLYYMWWALGMGSREDNGLTPEEIESKDKKVKEILSECLEILNPGPDYIKKLFSGP